jgi:hypothetical protein
MDEEFTKEIALVANAERGEMRDSAPSKKK